MGDDGGLARVTAVRAVGSGWVQDRFLKLHENNAER